MNLQGRNSVCDTRQLWAPHPKVQQTGTWGSSWVLLSESQGPVCFQRLKVFRVTQSDGSSQFLTL